MTLGQRIQHHRAKLNLSQEALGEKLGVTRQAVHKWEADGAVPDTDKLIALSKLFGITLNELLQVEEPKKEPAALDEEIIPENTQAPESTPKKLSRHQLAALLCCAAFLLSFASFTISVGKQLGAANDRIATLEWELSLLKGQLEQPTGLDPAASLVADFNFELSSQGLTVSLRPDLLPYQLPENLEVSFTLNSPAAAKTKTVTATREDGGHYTALLVMEGALPPLTVTATLSDGTNEYAQPLVRILNYDKTSYGWETLWDK